MSSFDSRYDEIERYLKDEMSSEQKTLFELEMLRNEALKEEVQCQKLSREMIRSSYKQEISDLIKEQHVKSVKRKKKLVSTAVLGALVTGGILLGFFFSTDEQQEVANKVSQGIEEIEIKNQESTDNLGSYPLTEKNEVNQSDARKESISNQGKKPFAPSVVEQIEKSKDTADKLVIPTGLTESLDVVLKDNSSDSVVGSSKGVKENVAVMEESNLTTEKALDCSNVINLDNVIVVNAGLEDEYGELILPDGDELKYSINGGVYSDNTNLTDLELGKYSVMVKDGKGCKKAMGVFEIKKNDCLNKKRYSLNLNYDEGIELQVVNAKSAYIVNSARKKVWESLLEDESSLIWNGTYLDGSVPIVGLHTVVVEGKENCKYYVSISK